jgi:hypothetical protein
MRRAGRISVLALGFLGCTGEAGPPSPGSDSGSPSSGGGGGGGDRDDGGSGIGGDGGGGSGSQESSAIYDEGTLATYRITMDNPDDWRAIVDDPFGAGDEWKPFTLEWSNGTETDMVTGVAVKAVGTNRKAGNPKPAIRLKFDELVPGGVWRGVDTVKLEGHILESFVERLEYGLYRELGLAAPRATHAQVVIDGDLKGVYGVAEPIRKKMIEHHLGIADPDGNLYERSRRVADGTLWTGDAYRWVDSDATSYVPIPFEAITNEVGGDYSDLVTLLDVLNHTSSGEIRARLEELIELDSYLAYLAALNSMADGDGIMHSTSNNHFWYHREDTGKLQLIPWDASNGFGAYWVLDATKVDEDVFARFGVTQATDWIQSDETARARYLDKVRAFRDGPLSGARARLAAIRDHIRAAVDADPYRDVQWDSANDSNTGLSMSRFDSTVEFMDGFIADRLESLRVQVP